MEENLHSINSMKNMEIIDINNGRKIGFIIDIKIDCENDKVLSLVLPGESKGWFNKSEEIEIPWEKVKKIGDDVILVSLDEYNFNETDRNIY
ncbi:MAG: YlmC/YmxH family sporulation protein [Clostridium sp.]|uniref:YlmC/YmxH family sporulation protein n=2 Tax=Clostridiaceae TaxID=31979 RepID=UPI00188345AF|nr:MULTISPECIES: YlmC/YmxH family sporulation protein [Clostridium]MCR6515897.1 YlmC/YmxH family sporulation protein [Clostridium sp. LY3-2]